MVSPIWATIAGSLGLLSYLLVAFVGAGMSPATRDRIAQWFWANSARAIGQPAIIERDVGGYSLMKWSRDDQKEAGKVTLDDSLLGDEKALYFADPDDRMGQWKTKPLAVLHEGVPAPVDAELATLGKRWRQHCRAGLVRSGDAVNPYFKLPTQAIAVSLADAKELIINGSEPADPAVKEDFTKKRFEKYRSMVGAVEVISAAFMAAVGFGLVAAGAYVRDNLLSGGGGSGPVIEQPLSVAVDAVVLLL